MTDDRPDPDALLARLHETQAQKIAHGKISSLRVFLGMCPGVGKTFAMLQAAHGLKAQGIDVIVGVVETHGRSETAALLEGLEVIPLRQSAYRGVEIAEMDIDAILVRKPAIVLVDELAHTNAPNSRHPKRHQDVSELLDAGIAVFTTLNVQHVESRADIIAELTGVTVRETVPDLLLDRADEIQLVDLTPEQLRQRLGEGRVYLGERADAAAQNFFRLGNLAALRELALRYAAERAGKDFREFVTSQKRSGPQRTNERLLVAVGPSPSSESLIRWTRRAAGMLDAPWLAVTVDTGRHLDEPSRARLSRHLALVNELGGERITTIGHDLCDTILATARERNITQIVVGKPKHGSWWRRLWQEPLVDRLIDGSGDIDVHVVRPSQPGTPVQTSHVPTEREDRRSPWREVAIAMAIVAAMTLTGNALLPWIGYWSVALFYLLAMVLAALRLGRKAIISMAAVSALCWNLLFIPPRFTFYITQPHDLIMFCAYFVVAIAIGHVTTQLRKQQMLERKRERRTSTLLDFTQLTSGAPDERHAMERAIKRLHELFAMPVAIFRRNDVDHTLLRQAAAGSSLTLDDKNFSVAAWSQGHRRPSGRFTDTLPDSRVTCLPMQTRTSIMGVLAFDWPADRTFSEEERGLLEALAAQLALVLEKEHLSFAMQRAEIAEQSNRLHKSLLDSVSHELKTPLAALRAALDLHAQPSDERQQVLHGEMHAATRRFERVVNHLLDMTRIESAQVKAHLEWCDVEEIISDTVRHAGMLETQRITMEIPSDMPLVHIDPVLTETLLTNLLHNAATWNEAGMPIEIHVDHDKTHWRLQVRDHGPGIPDSIKHRLFDKFVRAEGAPAGGTGLGLSIVRGFAKAQGASVHAENAVPHGALFTVRFPLPAQTA